VPALILTFYDKNTAYYDMSVCKLLNVEYLK